MPIGVRKKLLSVAPTRSLAATVQWLVCFYNEEINLASYALPIRAQRSYIKGPTNLLRCRTLTKRSIDALVLEVHKYKGFQKSPSLRNTPSTVFDTCGS